MQNSYQRGTPFYEYTIVDGSLPTGLTLDTDHGTIEGPPTTIELNDVILGLRVISHMESHNENVLTVLAGLEF